MSGRILNFGSLNVDHVYQVDHIVRPGETLPGGDYQIFAGGKGANQSAALALAGAQAYHAGCIGPEGQWLLDKLVSLGVNTDFVQTGTLPTGHAIIQVDSAGQNAIVLYPGCNFSIETEQISRCLDHFGAGDTLLLQNETNAIPQLISRGRAAGLKICFNPAPFTPQVDTYPLHQVDLLIVNHTEGQGLSGQSRPAAILEALSARLPHCEIILTLGEEGVHYHSPDQRFTLPANRVDPVDTTAAGDTFIGYYLAEAHRGAQAALDLATRAAALCITRPGAMASIPSRDQID